MHHFKGHTEDTQDLGLERVSKILPYISYSVCAVVFFSRAS